MSQLAGRWLAQQARCQGSEPWWSWSGLAYLHGLTERSLGGTDLLRGGLWSLCRCLVGSQRVELIRWLDEHSNEQREDNAALAI